MLKILLIDDDQHFREYLRRVLLKSGHAVEEAAGGVEGLETCAVYRPDLVLVDLEMPDMTGLELVERFVADTPEMPVIVISGTGDMNDVIQAHRLGAWDYISKPVDVNVLLWAIERASERAKLILENRNNQEELEQKIKDRTRQLIKANQAKSRFLSNMSHELRTPLNSMLVLSELLAQNKSGNLTDPQLQYVTTIHHSGKDLLRLIEDLLDLSKIEAGKMQLQLEELNLKEMLLDLQMLFEPMVEKKGLELSIHISEFVPQVILSDYQRMLQVLRNMVSNALKFTETGSIQVLIDRPVPGNSCLVDSDPDRTLAISVTDTGIGIPPDQCDLVFDEFKQADNAVGKTHYKGTGLGLPISRKLARALGGDIDFVSELNHGSCFTLYLPEALATERPVVSEPVKIPHTNPINDCIPVFGRSTPTEENTQFENRQILIVDDDPRNIFVLASVLEGRGARIVTASCGEEALNCLKSRAGEIDMILMDMVMPGDDGCQVIRQIRRLPKSDSLPIIAITAHVLQNGRARCLRAGADDYLAKPVEINKLLRTVCLWMDKEITRSA
jgi:two-component system, chemotaxis family, sensor kinase CheA